MNLSAFRPIRIWRRAPKSPWGESPFAPTPYLKCTMLFLTLVASLVPSMGWAQDTARVEVRASTGIDTLVLGVPGGIVVYLSTGEIGVGSATFSFRWHFTNGNIVGPLPPPTHPVFSLKAVESFEDRGSLFGTGADPDSTLVSVVEFGNAPVWLGTGEIFRFNFVPMDTGQIQIDPQYQGVVPSQFTEVNSWPNWESFEVDALAPAVTVVECSTIVVPGDVNRDGLISSSDLIMLVNYVFKSGPEPLPVYVSGDVNCSGTIDSADIIGLVNFVFKSGLAPCDVCDALTVYGRM